MFMKISMFMQPTPKLDAAKRSEAETLLVACVVWA